MEVDIHADTFVAGRNCVVMHYTERVADVLPYSDEYQEKKGIPIVQTATGHTHLAGQRPILIVNEALWMPDLHYSLFNPNQFREYGVVVQDNPYSHEPMYISTGEGEDNFMACMESDGTTIYIDMWTPTQTDLEEQDHVILSSPREWNSSTIQFPSMSECERQRMELRKVTMNAIKKP